VVDAEVTEKRRRNGGLVGLPSRALFAFGCWVDVLTVGLD